MHANTTQSTSKIGETLPNLWGTILPIPSGLNDGNSAAEGCFSNSERQSPPGSYNGIYDKARGYSRRAVFNANAFNGVYQDNGRVRPYSYSCKWFIRFK